jgi:benzylsuccinate CoA-transferase BbsF subunit
VPGEPELALLSGIRVLDFGWVWAGALAGQIMAFLGAEVIKIETRTRLDYMRLGPPIVGDQPDPEQQPMFHNVNRGKLSFTVDFRTDEGRALILDLVEHCDVVVENFSPGVLERYGLDYDRLRERRPDVVMLSLSAGGHTGPLRDMRGYASTIAAYSGLDSLAGYPGEEPLGIQQSYPDPNASLHGLVGILAGLHRRKRTGEGDHVDMSQLAAGMATIGEAMAHIDLFAEEMPTIGNAGVGGELIHECFRCAGADNWVAVDVANEAELSDLAALLGCEQAGFEAVRTSLARWCEARDHVEAMEALQAAGVPAGAVTTAADRFNNKHYGARNAYIETEHPVIGWEVVYGEPWQWSNTPGIHIKRAPMLGEANEYVVCEVIGRSPADFARLVKSKVIY